MTLGDLAAIETLEQTPLALANLPNSTYQMLQRSAARHSERPALSFFASMQDMRTPQTWSYRQLLEEIHRFANALHGHGYGADDVVAYVLPNLPQTHFVLWGAEANGIVLAVNPLLSSEAIAQLLQSARAKVVVSLAQLPGHNLAMKVQQALKQVDSVELLVNVELMPGMAATDEELRNGADEVIAVTSYSQFVQNQPSNYLLSERNFDAGAVSSYFCTGGTTGLPKIAVREHGNEVFDAHAMLLLMGDAIGPGKSLFCGLPLFHANGQLVTGLAPWSVGAHVVLGTPEGYRGNGVLQGFWEIVEHYRINFFSGVPTIYSALLQVPHAGIDISSLELGMCGAAPMPVELFRRFQDVTGLRILEGYGLTEGACVSSLNPLAGESRIGSIGLRLPYQQMRTLRLDSQGMALGECAPGEIGAIAISGPNVFRGYLQAEHNHGIWVDLGDGQRWLNTGDLGHRDEQGYFWLTGRKKELIIRGGHNIDPQLIEEPLYRHPEVEMAAAVARPDAHAGELPVAYVKLRAGSVTTEEQLLAYLAGEIAEPAALPKRLLVVDALPLTAVGKIFKPGLVIREIEDVVRTLAAAVGAQLKDLQVIQDPQRGYLARITLLDSHTVFETQLGRFGIRFEITGAPQAA